MALFVVFQWIVLKLRADISTGEVSEYLLDILPKKRKHVSPYSTCNKYNYILPRCRLEFYGISFIPDGVRQWNLMNAEVRENLETKVTNTPI